MRARNPGHDPGPGVKLSVYRKAQLNSVTVIALAVSFCVITVSYEMYTSEQ